MKPLNKRILVISSAENVDNTATNDQFIADLQDRLEDGFGIQWTNYHGLRIEFTSGRVEVILNSENIPLSEFDFVYFKSFFRYSELAGVIADYLVTVNTPFVSSELKSNIALTKLSQLTRMALNNIPMPKTIFMLNNEFKQSFEYVKNQLGLPFIFKSTDGAAGEENYLISSLDQMIDAINEYPDLKFIAQSFIPNDSDLRVLIVGKEIKLIIKRQRTGNDTHLNNTSQGANSFIVPLDELDDEYKELSLKSAEIMNREIAGVDLMFNSDTGEPIVLEVNASPQIASGAFTDIKLDIYGEYFNNVLK